MWGEWGIFHVTQKCSHALLSISIAHYTHFNRQAQTWQQLNIYYTSIQPSGLCENTLSLQSICFASPTSPDCFMTFGEVGMNLRGVDAYDHFCWCIFGCQKCCLWTVCLISVCSALFIVGRHLYCFVMLCTSCRFGRANYESCWCMLRYQTGSQIFCYYLQSHFKNNFWFTWIIKTAF